MTPEGVKVMHAKRALHDCPGGVLVMQAKRAPHDCMTQGRCMTAWGGHEERKRYLIFTVGQAHHKVGGAP
eukprot:6491824-Amphidinium_carterae.2